MGNTSKIRKGAFAYIAAASVFIASCSIYRVRHTETMPDTGKVYETTITEIVPPGGKKLSEGMADIGIDESGAWHVRIGASVNSDSVKTGEILKIAAKIVGAALFPAWRIPLTYDRASALESGE